MLSSIYSWKVVCTYTNYEKKIHLDLAKKNIESFLPTYLIKKKWRNRNRFIETPLFPNYLFIRADKRSHNEILSIKGVRKYLHFDGKPAIIPDKEIEHLRFLSQQQHKIIKGKKEIEVNSIIVLNGLLKGMKGNIVSRLNASYINVFFESLNNIISLDLTVNKVSTISDSQNTNNLDDEKKQA